VFDSTDFEKFASFHNTLALAAVNHKFVVEERELQWQDFIDCVLRCVECGRRYRLTVETYHGRGGEWREEPP
jgi:hypothetical protein